MSSSIASFFASFVSNADATESQKASTEDAEVVVEESSKQEKAEETEDKEEEEEEEPEDVHPVIREECKETSKCAPLTKHFEHCQEKVANGEGFKGEDCVEELCMCLHCSRIGLV
ncbi:hypothetical protein D9619_011948 [Psilocybe cf. subviscida]|uniref:Ubiquinol-cytochrome C reductase hinge domain-containing protein n=1 Tax=Psilocybe cf. subviscida TaxID=2480587 RepID=A0A8H5EWB5_9AGAR|nr:hypothetical protein D9619_011948 [Psilocybe cf. subviscida]